MSDTPNITPCLSNDVYSIEGFLSANEAELLYRCASEVPAGGQIVEIGSYRGKSTVCLGLGAKQSGAVVWAIDPHENLQVNDETHYGPENYAALLSNLVKFEVTEVVRVLPVRSQVALDLWVGIPEISLTWIDGSHKFIDAYNDLTWWGYRTLETGKMLVHDTSGHFPEVNKALRKFTQMNKWHVVDQIDAIAVLEHGL